MDNERMLNMEYVDYINQMISEGYIADDGTPLKCNQCDSKSLEEYDEYYEEHWGRVEFAVRCKDCNARVGTWGYGNWSII